MLIYSMNSYAKIYKCIDDYGHINYTDKICTITDKPNIINKAEPAPVLAKPILKNLPNQKNVSMPQTYLNPSSELSSPPQSPKNTSFLSWLFEYVSNFFKRSPDNNANRVKTVDTDVSKNQPTYQCDGRTKCSQMTSCEEATFFINNCPDTKMDGNNDGIPCEKQWCR
ncbi:MAG: excalibur calcium-binding domain-containing protein [Methylococcales bacterium]